MFTTTIAMPENVIAEFHDQAAYRIHRVGDTLITVINGGVALGGEEFAETLTRAAGLDALLDTDDVLMQTQHFGVGEMMGESIVWIDGEAFTVEFAEDLYIEICDSNARPAVGDALIVLDGVLAGKIGTVEIRPTADDARTVVVIDGSREWLAASTKTMSLIAAVRLVVRDQRAGDHDGMTVAELVDHARNTIGIEDIYHEIGDDLVADAYRAVLSADPQSLIAAEAVVVGTAV